MEIFELRYFLAVAATENIHRASETLNVSPASLSKAISRLESELSVKLFRREGRNIELTGHGHLLQKKASAIVHLEEAAKLEVAGHAGSISAVIAGPEVLLARFGVQVAEPVLKKHPGSKFIFHGTTDDDALERVAAGDAHLAVVTGDVAPSMKLTAKIIGETKFMTYAGRGHALFSKAKNKVAIPVEEVLKHGFASPADPLLGRVGAKQSFDGWRDDQFQRRIDFTTSSLKILEELVVGGRALAYLPEYFAEKLDVQDLKISGCPYFCAQKIKLVARHPKDVGWINRLF